MTASSGDICDGLSEISTVRLACNLDPGPTGGKAIDIGLLDQANRCLDQIFEPLTPAEIRSVGHDRI